MTSRHMSDGASMRTRERRDMTYRVVGDGEQLIHRLLQRLHDRRRPRRLNRSCVSENPPRSALSLLARVRSIHQPLVHLHDGRRIRQRFLRRARKPVDDFSYANRQAVTAVSRRSRCERVHVARKISWKNAVAGQGPRCERLRRRPHMASGARAAHGRSSGTASAPPVLGQRAPTSCVPPADPRRARIHRSEPRACPARRAPASVVYGSSYRRETH
jgi:hypothetical protein